MQDKYPKILLLAGWYPHSLNQAEGDFIKYQAKMMHDAGVNISVLHSSMTYKYWMKGMLIKNVKQSTKEGLLEYIVERPFVPRNSSWAMSWWRDYFIKDFNQYLKDKERPDLIHAHTYLAGYVASKIKESYGLPYILTLHETSLLDNSTPLYHEPFVDKALREAKEVVAVSQGLSDKVKEKYNVKVRVLNNFINFETFSGEKKKSQPFTFVYVGDLIERKNVSLLIDAFSSVSRENKNVRLKIIGDGPCQMALTLQVERLNLRNRVSFLGRKPQKEVASILCSSSCLVNASKTETFGLVFAEAMACGLPVISTPSIGPKDIINNDCGILLNTFEKEELISAMQAMVDTAHLYNPEQLRAYAYSKFSSEKIVRGYKQLYRKVLDEAEKKRRFL